MFAVKQRANIKSIAMKKIMYATACMGLLALTACKKDRDCECTSTRTNTQGVTTTDEPVVVTYKEVKNGEAKSLCQKTTYTEVDDSGKTSTQVDDCKLK
jgi:hypothetical protein